MANRRSNEAGVPRWRPTAVGVCVPVRDEAALLPDLLGALERQRDFGDATLVVCFLLDGCVDGSADAIARFAGRGVLDIRVEAVPPGDEPNAGRARRRAIDLGRAATAGAGATAARAALLTTDADSVPAGDWIAANLVALEEADVAAGRIERIVAPADRGRGADPVQSRIEAYYDRLFALRRTIDPVPWEAARTHHYTSGASLAFRGCAYAAIGGFAARPSAEDAGAVDAAHAAGLRVRRDADVRVGTSSRTHGRAADGLADHLRALERAVDAPVVAHPADEAWRYAGHAAARDAFDALRAGGSPQGLANRIAVAPDRVRRTLAAAPNAEAFAMRVVGTIPGGGRSVGLDEAEAALRHLRRPAMACA